MDDRMRVASVPAGHVYVRNIAWSGDEVDRLADPPTTGPGWWPPPMLDPAWIDDHAGEFDIFHLHFGFDALEPEELRRVCESLREHSKPLVYTVHDLRNPHHRDPSLHDRQLEVLLSESDRLITLTRKAKDEIFARSGQRAALIPHPHVVPFRQMTGRSRKNCGTAIVGVHLKSLRANMDGLPVLRALSRESRRAGFRLRVDIHNDAWSGRGDVREALRAISSRDEVDFRVHDYFSDQQFIEYLDSIDVAVLPYAFGTHSGWLEACRDLGTAVVVPDCGCYSDQGRVYTYRLAASGPVEPDLEQQISSALAAVRSGTVEHLSRETRLRQRQQIAAQHRRIYCGMLG